MLQKLKNYLLRSDRIHVRGRDVGAGRELITLIDAFLDNSLSYPLQWDDFVSWKSKDSGMESIRMRIAPLEPLFLSRSAEDRKRATIELVQIRNDLALSHGLENRSVPE